MECAIRCLVVEMGQEVGGGGGDGDGYGVCLRVMRYGYG